MPNFNFAKVQFDLCYTKKLLQRAGINYLQTDLMPQYRGKIVVMKARLLSGC